MPWCTGATKWNQKAPLSNDRISVEKTENYLKVDFGQIIGKLFENMSKPMNGIAIAPENERGFTMLSMGDNCYQPIILEIKMEE